MARENPVWGEERIANELSLKLGIRISPRTVASNWTVASHAERPISRSRCFRWTNFLNPTSTKESDCVLPVTYAFPLNPVTLPLGSEKKAFYHSATSLIPWLKLWPIVRVGRLAGSNLTAAKKLTRLLFAFSGKHGSFTNPWN